MGNQFSPWSDFELNQLKELAGHFSAPYISAQIGRSDDGVRKTIKKLGLKELRYNRLLNLVLWRLGSL